MKEKQNKQKFNNTKEKKKYKNYMNTSTIKTSLDKINKMY